MQYGTLVVVVAERSEEEEGVVSLNLNNFSIVCQRCFMTIFPFLFTFTTYYFPHTTLCVVRNSCSSRTSYLNLVPSYVH